MFEIDIKTVLYLLSIGNVLSIVLLVGYGGRQTKIPSFLFLLGRFFQAVAWILLAMRGQIPDVVSAYTGNVVLFAGFALDVLGFICLSGRNIVFIVVISFLAVSGAGIYWVLGDSPGMRVAVASAVGCVIYGTACLHILMLRQKSLLHRAILVLLAFFCSVLALRSFFAFASGGEAGIFSSTVVNALAFYSIFGLMYTSGFGQVLLLKQEADRMLESAASTDPLTGVLNRRAFYERILPMMKLAVRTESSVSLLMLDLDHFKTINDSYGHAAGDMVLQDFSGLVSELVRDYDLFGRIGGEEFCILLMCSNQCVDDIAERIRLSVKERIVQAKVPISYTVSIGVFSGVPEHPEDYEHFIARADENLYAAKNGGRDRVVSNI